MAGPVGKKTFILSNALLRRSEPIERTTAATQPILLEPQASHTIDSDQQASYLKVWVTVGLRLELRMPAQMVAVVAVEQWLDLLGKRHSS